MSKTISTQIEKTNALIQGIRDNYTDAIKASGLSEDFFAETEACCTRLHQQDEELDKLREDVHKRVQECAETLEQLKNKYQKARMVVRNNYSQEQWIKFGLYDKR